MNWKEQLAEFENNKQWDAAIEFMQKVIVENLNSVDAYINMNYLLMNLLVEEDHDESKHNYYEKLTKKYFDESYAKFSNDAEYLFFTAFTACMSEWYFGLDEKGVAVMAEKALQLDPTNMLYAWGFPAEPDMRIPKNRQWVVTTSKKIISDDSVINYLKDKGIIGAYLLMILTNLSKDK